MGAQKPSYEFGGPSGATAIVFGLPSLMNVLYFGCNDVSGCPAPASLHPSSSSWAKLKTQIPWPERGLQGFLSWKVTGWLAAYYLLSLVLYRISPATEVYGTKSRESGKPLKYRFNAFAATVVQLGACAVGTLIWGAEFPVWKFIADNYSQSSTGNSSLSYVISVWVYLRSFTVKPGNKNMRESAKGGHTGNVIYDFYIGRESNPRVTSPFFGEIDVKAWLEMRPGLTGWILSNCSFIAKQVRSHGYVSDSILIVAAVQGYYASEGQYFESGISGMMDIVHDGLGFMLTFGDIVWVPFLYCTMTRYLSVYPVHLGWTRIAAIAAVFSVGLYIFRSANSQKNRFRTNPDHPSVKDMPYIQTKRGTRLLTGGWWGRARHINYFGDWIQSLPFCLPTGLAGYVIVPAGTGLVGAGVRTMLDGRQVTQEGAAPWGMLFTYSYSAYFVFLLIHRERRDDTNCAEKYGEDWEKYRKQVPWRIVPGVY